MMALDRRKELDRELDREVQVAITRICGSEHHFCKQPLKIKAVVLC